MASFRSTKMTIPVGSASWISTERDSAVRLIQQEEEDFEFSVINEMEWLNEHMADIFCKARKTIVDVLKTPGKLRGKTPWTARRRDAMEQRAPLTDIFAPNQQVASGSPDVVAYDDEDAEDAESIEVVPMTDNPSQLENTPSPPPLSDDGSSPVRSVLRKSSLSFATLPAREPLTTKASIGTRVSRTSHLEGSVLHGAGHTSILGHQAGGIGPAASQSPAPESDHDDDHMDLSADKPALISKDSENDITLTQLHRKTSTQRLHERISQLGQSQTARTSKSIPSLLQQVTLSDLPVSPKASVPSEVAKPASQRAVTKSRYDDDDEDWIPPIQTTYTANPRLPVEKKPSVDIMEDVMGTESAEKEAPDVLVEASQSEKQLSPELMEGIIMDKDSADNQTPEVPAEISQPEKQPSPEVDQPQMETEKQTRTMHEEPALVPTVEFAQAAVRVPRPIDAPQSMMPALEAGASTNQTTMTRPNFNSARKFDDEPLSASKAKLSSIFKSARGLLASSAGTSAQAKLESMSQLAMAQLAMNEAAKSKASEERALEEELPEEDEIQEKEPRRVEPVVVIQSRRSSRHKRRSSDEDINMIGEVEYPANVILAEENGMNVQGSESSQPQSQPVTRSMKDVKRPIKPGKGATSKAKPVPVAIKVGMTSQREGDHRKGNQANPPNTTLSSNLQQSLGPTGAASTKQTRPVATNLRKVTAESVFKTSVSSHPPRPRALAAAAKKKEQDEREAQRKLEVKREIERKRLAHQEEEKKKEQQRKETEMQRQKEQAASKAEDPKKAAQKQAIERRRLENARKQEQQRNGPMQTRARAGNNLRQANFEKTSTIQREKTQTQMGPSVTRGDLSTARTVSKLHTATNIAGPSEGLIRGPPPINPARPAKRGPQVENANERPFGPPPKITSTYMQAESKRRKTNDGEEDIIMEDDRAIQQPMMMTQNPLNIVSSLPNTVLIDPLLTKSHQNNQLAAQEFDFSTPIHHGPNPLTSFKSTSLAQHSLQANRTGPGHSHPHHPPDMGMFANSRIPFGENAGNEAAGPSSTIQRGSQHKYPSLNGGGGGLGGGENNNQTESPSQEYINPSDIELPEIPTDSEEDDDDEDDYYADMRKQLNLPGKKKRTPFKVPDWAKSPALRETLMAQQLIDPRTVWGPIPPIDLEKEFRKLAGPKRLASYRQRTSSAYWGPDRLTEEECQKDMEARRRLMEQGEWSRDIYK
ncbi:MAG: hypothetical protein M1816_008079 [Peltula sp. TS41687]|nr:MAG: hypothetical protein M1816_008079 [Peltula sp. TS41687]